MHSKLRRDATTATKVILLRHGQSTSNAQGRYQGSSDDSVLTQKGHASAYQTGVALQHLPVDAIYTSPLIRAQETTREILAGLNKTRGCLPVRINRNLQEIHLPAWQGLSFTEVRAQFPAAYRCWQEQPHKFQIDAYASSCAVKQKCFPVLDLYAQAQQFWHEVLPHHAGETLLVVSHSGTNRALISTAIGLQSDRFHLLQQSNCGMSSLHFPVGLPSSNRVASPQLQALNFTSHLGETLPKLKAGKQGLRLILIPTDAIALPQIESLATQLSSVSIDFCLSGSFELCQKTANSILQRHSPDLPSQLCRQDLKQIQPQYLMHEFAKEQMALLTGLVVADNTSIKSILARLLGMTIEDKLQLLPGTISVIHYPQTSNKAVLQALNITDAALPAMFMRAKVSA